MSNCAGTRRQLKRPRKVFAKILQREIETAGVHVPDRIQEKLAQYCELVSHWNKRVNLTGLQGEDLVRRLVVEPIWIADRLGMSGVLIDIGSGNGSPALPIALARGMKLTQLVEARTRRAVFLRQVVIELEMSSVVVHKGRFEDMVGELSAADWITLQAVAPDRQILETLRTISNATTKIVWITSKAAAAGKFEGSERVKLPFSNTQGVLLRLEPLCM